MCIAGSPFAKDGAGVSLGPVTVLYLSKVKRNLVVCLYWMLDDGIIVLLSAEVWRA
jgi:hypothetical protein